MPSNQYLLMPRHNEIRGGHVENTVPPIWFENARVTLFTQIEQLTSPTAQFGVVRRATYDYARELFYGGEVKIVTTVSHIGNSSATFYQEAWQNDKIAVTAESILVMIDSEQGGKLNLSTASCDYLKTLMRAE